MKNERRFPDIEPEVRPTAQRVTDALRADVPPEVAQRHEALLRARLAGGDVRPLRSARRRARRTLVTLAAAAVLVLALPIVAVGSDRAVPGDLLYRVDRAVERFELAIATGPTNEVHALLGQAMERIEELEGVEEQGRLEAVGVLLEDLQGAAGEALERAEGDQELVGAVHEAIEMHTGRLQGVRDRLELSGRASSRALAALDRAIEAGRGGGEAGDRRGRPDDAGRPTDRGPQERPDDTPGGPPTEPPGRTGETGPPEGASDQRPVETPAGPENQPQSGQMRTQGDGETGRDGREFGQQQADEQGGAEGESPPPTGGPDEGGPPNSD